MNRHPALLLDLHLSAPRWSSHAAGDHGRCPVWPVARSFCRVSAAAHILSSRRLPLNVTLLGVPCRANCFPYGRRLGVLHPFLPPAAHVDPWFTRHTSGLWAISIRPVLRPRAMPGRVPAGGGMRRSSAAQRRRCAGSAVWALGLPGSPLPLAVPSRSWPALTRRSAEPQSVPAQVAPIIAGTLSREARPRKIPGRGRHTVRARSEQPIPACLLPIEC